MFSKTCAKKISSIVLALCIMASSALAVSAEAADSAGTSSSDVISNGQVSGQGFENVGQEGGTLFIGTARVPKEDGSSAAVKYIYSDGIVINEKSLDMLKDKLHCFGLTMPDKLNVSDSDVSESSLSQPEGRTPIFACGSQSTPTELVAYRAYESVEKSFADVYKGYIFSVSSYASLKNIFEGKDEITLSEDGQLAQTSVVMEEDYVDKVINGKTVTILMINSELKYSFRAPKLVFAKDESYMVSPSDATQTNGTSNFYGETTTNGLTSDQSMTVTSAETTSTSVAYDTSVYGETQTTYGSETVATSVPAKLEMSNLYNGAYLAARKALDSFNGTQSTLPPATQSTTTSGTTDISSTTSSTMTTGITTVGITTTSSTTNTTIGNSVLINPSSTNSYEVSEQFPITTNTGSSLMWNNENALLSRRGFVNTRRLPLNIRSGPGTSYMVVTVLSKGTHLTVLDTSNPDWYMVKTNSRIVGYAYSRYIKIT